MVASHRGLESLGRVLTLGVTTCTVTSLVFLPALLAILRPGRSANAEEETGGSDAVGAAGDGAVAEHAPARRRAA
jgi:predicted RND superfamily exporter protein